MVKIMISLSRTQEGKKTWDIASRMSIGIRLCASPRRMRERVDQECTLIANKHSKVIAVQQASLPVIPSKMGNCCGEPRTDQEAYYEVISLLPSNNRIILKVGHIDLSPSGGI